MWQNSIAKHEGLVRMTRTYSNWVGGVLKLHKLYTQRLGDMPHSHVVREGGVAGMTPTDFINSNSKYFKDKNKPLDFNVRVHVLEFELVDSYEHTAQIMPAKRKRGSQQAVTSSRESLPRGEKKNKVAMGDAANEAFLNRPIVNKKKKKPVVESEKSDEEDTEDGGGGDEGNTGRSSSSDSSSSTRGGSGGGAEENPHEADAAALLNSLATPSRSGDDTAGEADEETATVATAAVVPTDTTVAALPKATSDMSAEQLVGIINSMEAMVKAQAEQLAELTSKVGQVSVRALRLFRCVAMHSHLLHVFACPCRMVPRNALEAASGPTTPP